MQIKKINNKGQVQLFKNKYLEILTKSHPLIIWGIFLPLISWLLYYSYTKLSFSSFTITLIFLGGFLFWTLFEYLMHRFVFHNHNENLFSKRIAYMLHGVHHEYPRDKQRIFMPPLPGILIAGLVFFIMYLVLHFFAFIFFPGFIFGYLIYGTMHYAIHAWNPPFKWMKPLWRNHLMHHYKHEDKGFGVSSVLWDIIFDSTFDMKREGEDSEKARELMFTKEDE